MSNETLTLPDYANGVTLCLEELLAYKQQAVRWLPPAKSLWATVLGQHQSRQLGRGMDFAEVRQYQAGDDIRSIDWRVTARTGKPHTKLFTEEKEKPVMLYIDLTRSLFFGSTYLLKSVQLAHMASLLAWLSLAQKDRIGAVIDTGDALLELRPSNRNQGPLGIIQQLITVHNQRLEQPHHQASISFERALTTLNRLCPKGSEIILLSDFTRFEPQHDALIGQLRQHNRVRMVQFWDPLEHGTTNFRGVEQVSDSFTTQWLDFASKQTRTVLANSFQARQDALKSTALSHGVSFSAISSASPLLQQLFG